MGYLNNFLCIICSNESEIYANNHTPVRNPRIQFTTNIIYKEHQMLQIKNSTRLPSAADFSY